MNYFNEHIGNFIKLKIWKIILTIFAANLMLGCAHAQSNLDKKSDKAFLNKEPFRKGKQTVDLANLTRSQDLLIVEEAINDVMKFIYILAQTKINFPALHDVATDNGIVNLKFPPIQNQSNRFMYQKIGNWKIVNTETLSFDVEFRDLLKKEEPYDASFIFIRTNNGWRFDRHEL
ncbi:MAG: hypothetical protein ACEQSE_09020 [Candidatus Aquirickettsiella gammari]